MVNPTITTKRKEKKTIQTQQSLHITVVRGISIESEDKGHLKLNVKVTYYMGDVPQQDSEPQMLKGISKGPSPPSGLGSKCRCG